MIQTNSPDNGEKDLQPEEDVKPPVIYTPSTWPVVVSTVGLLSVAGGGIYALLHFSKAITDVAVAYNFIAQNGLSLFIFLAVVAQALIYFSQRNWMRKQWEVMRDQSKSVSETLAQTQTQLDIEIAKANPRLRVAEVRVENFTSSARPIFIVTIANDGLIDATGVQLHVGVQMDVDKELNWINDPVVMIPASGKECYFIVSSSPLEQQHLDGFNSNVPLKVIGHFTHWIAGRKDFCYKYLPWEGARPEGIPQFLPCDFEPRLNTRITVGTAHLKLNQIAPSGDVTDIVIHENPPNEPQVSVEKKEASEGKSDEAN